MRDKRLALIILLASAALLLGGCGRGKKVVLEEARPGRDKELFEQGLTELSKNKFIVGRLLLQTLITTYPDSPYLPIAKLAIADSFYLEGTSEALAQAEVEYTDFANFFPTHPLADDALLQVALAKMRRIQPPDRDQKPTREAERRLLAVLQRYPNTDRKDEVQQWLKAVRDVLAEHEMYVARHYMIRERPRGAKRRLMTIIERYPTYSKFDEALYRLGTVLFQEEEPEEAAKYFAWLVREFPNSEYRRQAAEMLERIGKPVPEVDPAEIARADGSANKGFLSAMWGKMKTVLGIVDLDVPKEGVLLRRGETAEELIASATALLPTQTVITPQATTVVVGPTAPAGAGGTAQGRQELRIGVTTGSETSSPDAKAKEKKDERKRPEKK
ncbi:MAG: outer membrane protein assembly factor BamD [Blastocatellia bacterium]|nr:outer membrane protein assembly factor BamD [Blastocatellia bacterium]MCS7156692.1 outer membrane protein assembly factor BamD [Blastocatellia bacterium]MCX7751566.1 outer membrane protein assembly factor BamD [Blastocatellia bacterium]MDW8168666.1 outer membrane protein assembly factor BamD [Acidobacteriota bacterium]MDW8256561.1 outer membrane protein assembly factor BamD [Acidobacteriota bacterium]